MSIHDLYAIYAAAYAESSHFESGRAIDLPSGLARRLRIPSDRALLLVRTRRGAIGAASARNAANLS